MDIILELIDQKSSILLRNLVWHFYQSKLKFVLFYNVFKLIFKVGLVLKDARLCTKLDDSSLFIDVDFIGVD